MKALVIVLVLLLAAPALAQTKRERVDQALLIGGLSLSSMALGLTMSCTSAGLCRELNPVMDRWIGDSPVKGAAAKSAINGAVYYGIWRTTKGKTRTIAIAAMTAVNAWDAIHDVRQMRRLGVR